MGQHGGDARERWAWQGENLLDHGQARALGRARQGQMGDAAVAGFNLKPGWGDGREGPLGKGEEAGGAAMADGILGAAGRGQVGARHERPMVALQLLAKAALAQGQAGDQPHGVNQPALDGDAGGGMRITASMTRRSGRPSGVRLSWPV